MINRSFGKNNWQTNIEIIQLNKKHGNFRDTKAGSLIVSHFRRLAKIRLFHSTIIFLLD